MTFASDTPISSITAHESLQLREDGLDTEIVSEYAQAMLEGAKFPPVKVVWDGEQNWLYDGFHRLTATVEAGYDTIDVEVIPGTRRDAWFLALGVNSDHGRNRTNADKRKVVTIALTDAEGAQWSDREVAKRCNVSNTFVGQLRKALGVNVDTQATPRDNSAKKPSDAKVTKKDALPPVEGAGEKVPEFHDGSGNAFDSKEQMLEAQLAEMRRENDRLSDALAAGSELPEHQQTATETIAELRHANKVLTAENNALKISRDEYMKQATEAIQQVKRMQRRLDQAGLDMKPVAKKKK